tara:strand:- start:2497 stop:4968 length:2472 start_codon:yes stop_codon:yes gene_type:complete
MNGWFLKQIDIEGFRGINNEGSPLAIKLKPDKVNSISAPNGVGKTSIFDAILYCLTGQIQKLEELPAAEKGTSYYLNRFHSGNTGKIDLTLQPENGDPPVLVSITRDNNGTRTVTAPAGVDGEGILTELNREFVLLDGKTFQQFIDLKPLDRGRSFAGLLGLRRYSSLRRGLVEISNTRAFNNHFAITAKAQAISIAKNAAQRASVNITEAYKSLVGDDLDLAMSETDLLTNAHSALNGIHLLKPICDGKTFEEIDPSECVNAAKSAEGGEAREKLAKILREQTDWKEAAASLPASVECDKLVSLAEARDAALENTQGDQFRTLYTLSEKILEHDEWEDKTICPTCDRQDDGSVLDHVHQKITLFEAVGAASTAVSECWHSGNWAELTKLEALAILEGEPQLIEQSKKSSADGILTAEAAKKITSWIKTISDRHEARATALEAAKVEIEKTLPEKLTAVVEKAEAARRLQSNLSELRNQDVIVSTGENELARIQRIKEFLDRSAALFAEAESTAASRRLEAIEPKCREIFAAIMFEKVTPALSKREGSEEISISLSEFWSIQDVSAQALLSESFRNAFAISVYLSAASLYGGPAKFVVLDDVTSSFDSGHQLHLMNVIRDQFARPGVPDGPQVILLSHDPVLEKLFNTNSNSGGWWHQCIQGTPRTAVLPQSGAVTKIKDATIDLLDVGNVDDAAPRIRQYLEFKLEEIILKVQIPVPITIAFNDDKHMASNLIDAINKAVNLHDSAGQLILEPAQLAGMHTATTTIIGNYISHWATGQTHAFSASSLKGVMKAIDDFAGCFQFEDPLGSSNFRYYKSLAAKY